MDLWVYSLCYQLWTQGFDFSTTLNYNLNSKQNKSLLSKLLCMRLFFITATERELEQLSSFSLQKLTHLLKTGLSIKCYDAMV